MSGEPPGALTFRQRVLLAVVFLVLGVLMFRHVDDAVFVGDESGWIASAYLHTGALLEGDLRPERWEFPKAYVYGNLNPQVGKIMLGLPLSTWQFLVADAPPFARYYDFYKSREENIAEGNVPPADTLRAARVITACYGVVLLWMLMLVVGRVAGWPAGIAAGALLVAHPMIVRSMNRAMTDVEYQLFMVAVCFPLIAYVRAACTRDEYRAALATGVLAGLACSVKIVGIVLGGLVLLPLLFLKVRHPITEWRRILIGGTSYVIAALITVYALNPFFWPSLPDEPRSAEAAQSAAVDWRVLSQVGYEREEIEAAYPLASGILRPLEFPLLFVRWNALLTQQISEFRSPPPTFVSYHARLLGEFAPFPGAFLLVLVGCGVALWHVRRDWAASRLSPYVVPLSFVAVNYVFWTATTRVELDRYYLSTLIAFQLLAGIGLGALFEALRKYLVARGTSG